MHRRRARSSAPGRRRSGRAIGRLTTWVAPVAALAAVPFLVATPPAQAHAATLPSSLAEFAHCPVDVKAVATCLFSSTTGTTFQIGSTTVSSTSPTTVSLGLVNTAPGQLTAVLPDDGTPALSSPAIALPGGLTGVSGLGSGDLAVSVTPQLVELPTINLGNLLLAKGPGLTLPIDVLVSTPSGALGSECTIADPAEPITLNLTTGTTDPPPPNTPITGAVGTLTSTNKGLLTDADMSLVDNAFAVPGADNCGPGGIVDEVLDLDKGLPSAAGSNSAVLSGSSYMAPAKLIRKYLH
jgi:hypothetical protein